MHHLLAADGDRLFPKGKRLVSHWNLRDELKALYSDPDGLAKQQMIYDVMLRIVRQTIPGAVINNPGVDWNLATNEVTVSPVIDGDLPSEWKAPGEAGTAVAGDREPDTRYRHWLSIFHAQQRLDPYYPAMPSLIDRRFQRDRRIPEAEVERLLTSVLSSPVVARTARLIERRLDRPLQPFDIWYDGFKTRSSFDESRLDSLVRERYPTAGAFRTDLPRIFRHLGFSDATADFLLSRVEVDPSRGIGHASAPGRRADQAHLRTRVGTDGMDYKGYNIATHELGHNVEQVFSLNRVDYVSLRGVPNTAFTEAFAFVFQARDLELLGLEEPDPDLKHMRALDDLWGTYEIAGVALVDMRVWRWLYAHPEATPAELREAVLATARDVWNEFFAPVIGVKDIEILAIYSHMIDAAMYLPDYPLGQLIASQIEQYLENRVLAEEMERMCRLGSISPDRWMRQAVGEPVSAEPMLQAGAIALQKLGG